MAFPFIAKIVDASSSRNGKFYVLFPDRFAGPLTESQTYPIARTYGLVAAGVSPNNVASNVLESEMKAAEQELAAARAAINAGLTAAVPVNVQGASEQFITNTMGQVVANTNQNAVQLNGSIFTARDQVKVHVTNEANRVIAAV